MSVAFILDAFANARKINKLQSKKSSTNVNSCCCKQMNTALGKNHYTIVVQFSHTINLYAFHTLGGSGNKGNIKKINKISIALI